MRRKAELSLVVGINGTGKTTFMEKEVVQKASKALILTPDSAEWRHLPELQQSELRSFTGARRLIYEGPETLSLIEKNFYGGVLILDDAMAYLNEQTPKTMQYLYIRRRQFGIDIYIVAHGLRQLPPKVFTFASWLILFNSAENFTSRKRDLLAETYEKIITAQERIRKKVLSGNPYYHEILLLDAQIQATYEQQRKNNR